MESMRAPTTAGRSPPSRSPSRLRVGHQLPDPAGPRYRGQLRRPHARRRGLRVVTFNVKYGRQVGGGGGAPEDRPAPRGRGRDRPPGDGRGGHGAHRPRAGHELRVLPRRRPPRRRARTSATRSSAAGRWRTTSKIVLPHRGPVAEVAAHRGRGHDAHPGPGAGARLQRPPRDAGRHLREQPARPGGGDPGRRRRAIRASSSPATSTPAAILEHASPAAASGG